MNLDIICATHFTWFVDESNSGGAVGGGIMQWPPPSGVSNAIKVRDGMCLVTR